MRSFDRVPCGGHTGKHRLQIEYYFQGQHVVLMCSRTACRKPLVVSHEAVQALVAR